MGRLLCITGTGTEVGKTAVALSVLLWAKSKGLNAAYLKLVQCGSRLPADAPFQGDADWMEAAAPDSFATSAIYTFQDPVSPHLAAERAGTWIDPEWILEQTATTTRRCDLLVVEGAGGAASPFARSGLSLADLAAQGEWPCLVVCPPGLGSLHQSRSTAHFLTSSGAKVAGLAMCPNEAILPAVYPDNRDSLIAFLQTSFFGILPFCPGLHKRLPLPPAISTLFAQALADGMTSWWQQT